MGIASLGLYSQAIILFAALALFTSFIMLAQTRMMPLIFTFAWQGLLLAVVSVLGPFSLYFAGLQHLEPTRAIVASCLEPVFSIVLAAVLLGEALRPIQSLGIVIVLVAIVIVQLPERAGAEVTVVEPIE